MTSSRFGDDRNGRELHVSVVHVWVLIKELLDFTLEILLGGESSGVLSYPDRPEIFIRPHRKNFDPQVAYLSICDGAERLAPHLLPYSGSDVGADAVGSQAERQTVSKPCFWYIGALQLPIRSTKIPKA